MIAATQHKDTPLVLRAMMFMASSAFVCELC